MMECIQDFYFYFYFYFYHSRRDAPTVSGGYQWGIPVIITSAVHIDFRAFDYQSNN